MDVNSNYSQKNPKNLFIFLKIVKCLNNFDIIWVKIYFNGWKDDNILGKTSKRGFCYFVWWAIRRWNKISQLHQGEYSVKQRTCWQIRRYFKKSGNNNESCLYQRTYLHPLVPLFCFVVVLWQWSCLNTWMILYSSSKNVRIKNGVIHNNTLVKWTRRMGKWEDMCTAKSLS